MTTGNELKARLTQHFQSLVHDLAAAEVVTSEGNPFDRVSLGPDFLRTMLTTAVMTDEELKAVLGRIDDAIARNARLVEIAGLVGQGLGILAKYGVLA